MRGGLVSGHVGAIFTATERIVDLVWQHAEHFADGANGGCSWMILIHRVECIDHDLQDRPFGWFLIKLRDVL